MRSSLKMWWFCVLVLTVHTCYSTQLDSDKQYEVLDNATLTTTRNANTSFQIKLDPLGTIQECFLESPDNEVFQILPAHQNNVTIPNFSSIFSACGVRITDMQTELQGDWILRTSFRSFLESIFRHYQQTWKVAIEEPADVIPSDSISSYVGEDIYIEMKLPIPVTSCSVKYPENETGINDGTVIVNPNCSFVLKEVSRKHNGVWEFRAIGEYTLLSKVFINVQDYPEVNTDIQLLHNFPTTIMMGPEEAVFCKAVNPLNKEYSYNGPCSIDIARVSYSHAGRWRVYVGFENAIETLKYIYRVTVMDSSDAPHPDYIIDSVELSSDKKLLNIKCTLMTEMRSCRMVRNDGKIFVMAQGIGNGRYSYYGNGIYSDKDGNSISECGIRVESPSEEDLKKWQCIIVTSNNTEIGKITDVYSYSEVVNNDTSMTPPAETSVRTHRGNTLELLCNYHQKIDYCWLLSPSKTVYSTTEDFKNLEYENIGDTALGSCGIRIFNARDEHRGVWTCNAGVANGMDEQRRINVLVYDSLVVPFNKNYDGSQKPTIGCKTYDDSPVEYCRFIRPDGAGINPSKVTENYLGSATDLNRGICYLTLRNPKTSDIGVWRCIAKPYDSHEHSDTINVHFAWYGYNNNTTAGVILSLVFYITITVGLTCVIISLIARTNIAKKCVRRVRNSIRKNRSPSTLPNNL